MVMVVIMFVKMVKGCLDRFVEAIMIPVIFGVSDSNLVLSNMTVLFRGCCHCVLSDVGTVSDIRKYVLLQVLYNQVASP